MNKNWILLIIAAVLEVMWVIGLAHAFNVITWICTVVLIIVSNYMMINVSQKLPVGTVYTVFVGLGAGGTVIAEILFFGEAFQWMKIVLIIMLLSAVMGLKLITDHDSRGGHKKWLG